MFHNCDNELVKDHFDVVGSGRCLGVELDRHDAVGLIGEAFDGVVVEVSVSYFDALAFEEAAPVDGVAVVVRRYVDTADTAAEVLDGLVSTAVTKGKHEGVSTECAGQRVGGQGRCRGWGWSLIRHR